MGLTVKRLKELGVEAETREAILEGHAETVNGYKEEISKLNAKLEGANAKAARVDELEKQLEEASKGDGFKEMYEELDKTHEAYKAEVEARESNREKADLYRKMLASENVDPKRHDRIMSMFKPEEIEIEDGKIKDADKVAEAIRTEWADFVVKTSQQGANVPNPPSQSGGSTAPATLKEALYERYNSKG